jgi:lipopolysaccharide biosynthesis glycosyltransferase
MPDPTLHIACGANVGYLPYAATMLHSLLTHNPDVPVAIHFMHDEALPASELEKLAGMVQGFGAQWHAHCIVDGRLEGFPVSWRFSREAWYRALLPDLLPKASRVLYLDADTLILRPLKPLWDVDLRGKAIAAVINPLYPFMDAGFLSGLGLRGVEDYFNSGVLLMDLDRWRAEELTARLVEFVARHGQAQNWPDQNALNHVLRDRWFAVDPIWNAHSIFFDLPASKLSITDSQWQELRRDPAIVHFIAPYKPLEYLCKHPYRERHLDHLRQTPWRNAPITGATVRNRVLRLLPQPFMWLALRRLRLLRQRLSAMLNSTPG